MRHRFYTTPETAHELTAQKKKHGFYFRTLTRTDRSNSVYCETTEPGYQFIIEHGYDVEWAEDIEQEHQHGGARQGAGRKSGERKYTLYVRISKEANDIISRVANKSEFIDNLLKQSCQNNS